MAARRQRSSGPEFPDNFLDKARAAPVIAAFVQQDLEHAKQNLGDLRVQIKQLKRRAAEQSQENITLETERTRLEEAVRDANIAVESLRSEAGTLRNEISTLNTSVTELTALIQRCNQEVADAATEKSALHADIAAAEASILQLQGQISTQTDEISTQTGTIQTLTEEATSIRKTLTEKIADLENATGELVETQGSVTAAKNVLQKIVDFQTQNLTWIVMQFLSKSQTFWTTEWGTGNLAQRIVPILPPGLQALISTQNLEELNAKILEVVGAAQMEIDSLLAEESDRLVLRGGELIPEQVDVLLASLAETFADRPLVRLSFLPFVLYTHVPETFQDFKSALLEKYTRPDLAPVPGVAGSGSDGNAGSGTGGNSGGLGSDPTGETQQGAQSPVASHPPAGDPTGETQQGPQPPVAAADDTARQGTELPVVGEVTDPGSSTDSSTDETSDMDTTLDLTAAFATPDLTAASPTPPLTAASPTPPLTAALPTQPLTAAQKRLAARAAARAAAAAKAAAAVAAEAEREAEEARHYKFPRHDDTSAPSTSGLREPVGPTSALPPESVGSAHPDIAAMMAGSSPSAGIDAILKFAQKKQGK